ncbi:MAG: GAF domain-containing protein [Candidatus Caldipriscus sp.]|nr:GAF domain-containing protein [Candidatus Caldipriscus sp.]
MKTLKDQINRIKAHRERYHWVGIYIKRDDVLELYPYYIGRPTPHMRIPISEGICGAAVREGITINVPDVNSDPRYLACSVFTRSEIVVPIYNKKGEIVGEIDIDSDRPGAFDEDDRVFLEGIAKEIGEVWEECI